MMKFVYLFSKSMLFKHDAATEDIRV